MAELLTFPSQSRPRLVETANEPARDEGAIFCQRQLSAAGKEIATALLDINDSVDFVLQGHTFFAGRDAVSPETLISLCRATINVLNLRGGLDADRDLRRALLALLQQYGGYGDECH
jgi:hypothetical protein